ncbi:MAG: hypothetical protein K2W95_00035 [Candidatus Obscuribacterales bacterium]|nr:hypothetical protein [Candidatus Obscuribacterales bacterium]
MADRPELAINNQLAGGNIDTVGSKLQREAELLRDGLGSGIVNRAQEMWDNPGDTALNLGACAGAGLALNLASRAGGRWAAGARLATGAFTLSLGVDVVRRGVPTLGAMADNWSNPGNFESNKDTVAKYAGSALVDYPAMMLAGYGGYRVGGAIPMKTTQFQFNELGPLRDMRLDPSMQASTKALLDSGIPINAATRGAMNNPSIRSLAPGERAAAVRALTEGPGAAPKLELPANPAIKAPGESALPINPQTRAIVSGKEIQALPPGERSAAVRAILEGQAKNPAGGLGGKGGTELPKFEFPKFDPPKFDAGNLLMTRTFSVTSPRLIPTVVPFDLIQRTENQLVAGKALGEGLLGAAAGAAGVGILQRLHQMKPEQPKVEEAPMPREVPQLQLRQLEIPALQLEPQKNAFIIERKKVVEQVIEQSAKPKEK